jgi:hypothetical protein
VFVERGHRVSERFGRLLVGQQACHIRYDGLEGAAAAERDDRPAARHRLDGAIPKSSSAGISNARARR